jgi:hypothetical protein
LLAETELVTRATKEKAVPLEGSKSRKERHNFTRICETISSSCSCRSVALYWTIERINGSACIKSRLSESRLTRTFQSSIQAWPARRGGLERAIHEQMQKMMSANEKEGSDAAS